METDRRRMQTRTADVRFATREEGGVRRIEGYFATFTGVYPMGAGVSESIDPHAFDGTLGGDIRALIDHNPRLVLGRTGAGTLRLRVDEQGLWGEIDVNERDTDAMNLYARVQRGDVSQCSFGFDIEDEETQIDGQTGVTRFILKRVKLYEVSCVTFPAYEDTRISARARQARAEKERQAQAWREEQRRRLKRWHSGS